MPEKTAGVVGIDHIASLDACYWLAETMGAQRAQTWAVTVPDATAQATVRAERLLLWVFLFGRLAPVSQAVLAASGPAGASAATARFLPVFALLAGESAALSPFAWSASGPGKRVLLAADQACAAAALIWGTVIASTPGQLSWLLGNLLYIYGMSGTLFASRRRALAAAACWLVLAEGAAVVRFFVVFSWGGVWHAVALVLFMLLVFTLADEYRRAHQSLDRVRAQEVAQERMLAAERERGKHYRALHDHVLQTMEFLARGRWITDPQVRAHVVCEAQWLRQLISGQLTCQPDGLAMALASVSNAQATRGLRTDLHAGQSHLPLSADAVDAVAAAAGEALANVRKHANTGRAVVSVRPAGAGVLVTIADGGCGFDPAMPTAGLGIAQSIHARMRQAGGRARLHSAPGQGTCVELWVPAPSQPRDHEPGQRK